MKSRVIFQNQHYTACALRDGSLTVESNRKHQFPRGKRLDGPQVSEWIDAIERAPDPKEAHALCHAFLTSS